MHSHSLKKKSICLYSNGRSTCKKAAILWQHVSTADQNVDLLRVWGSWQRDV